MLWHLNNTLEVIQRKHCGSGDGFVVVNIAGRDQSVTKIVDARNVAPVMFYKRWIDLRCPAIYLLKQKPFLYKVAYLKQVEGYTLERIGATLGVQRHHVNDRIKRITGKYITAWLRNTSHTKLLGEYESLLQKHSVEIQKFNFPYRQHVQQLDLL